MIYKHYYYSYCYEVEFEAYIPTVSYLQLAQN